MKAVLYCRVDGPESEQALEMLDHQRRQLIDYAQENKIPFTNVYMDCGYTGRSLDRPGLQKVLAEIHQGHAGMILAVNSNRLFRGPLPPELRGIPVHTVFKEPSRELER